MRAESRRSLPLVCLTVLVLLGLAQATTSQVHIGKGPLTHSTRGQVKADKRVHLFWDAYGVPHVYAKTDAQAFFGLGYASAKMRLFQMHWQRLMVQGRVAEHFGPGTWTHPVSGVSSDVFVSQDHQVRVLGWQRHATRVAANLEAAPWASAENEAWRMLQAYADGVNRYMATADTFHPHFDTWQVPREPWTPADSIGIWIRLGSFLGPNGLDEAAQQTTWLDLVGQGASDATITTTLMGQALCDDSAPAVLQSDVPQDIQDALAALVTSLGLDGSTNCPLGAGAPQFSEAWAVAGSRTTTGRAIVSSEPRIPLYVPNTFFEWHVRGRTFDVRGAGLPGSPNVYFGSTPHNAWGMTVLSMDQADLFELEVDPAGHPEQYQLDGVWHPWDLDVTETILIEDKSKGIAGPSQSARYRETHFGPVVTSLAGQTGDGEYARKAVPFHDPSTDSFVGFLAMYRAKSLQAFGDALADWSYPSANVVFGSKDGRIGYWANGHLPIRHPSQPYGGRVAMDGASTANDWLGILDHDLLPWVIDPARGFVHSANHMTVGSWYPIPNRPGPAGETHRSRRLREMLEALPPLVTPQQAGLVRKDATGLNASDLTLAGLWVRDAQAVFNLSPQALLSLAHLEPWLAARGTLDNAHYATALAHHVPNIFPSSAQTAPFVAAYGAGQAGMALWIKNVRGKLEQAVPLSGGDVGAVDWFLSEAWSRLASNLAADGIAVADVALWPSWYQQTHLMPQLDQWAGLGVQSDLALDPTAFQAPILISNHPDTLLHQEYQSYSMTVEVGLSDGASSMLAPGQAEGDTEFPQHQEDQVALWALGDHKPSPTTARGIRALGPVKREVLTYEP